MTKTTSLLNNVKANTIIENGKAYREVLKETNKHYNKTLKGKTKDKANQLANEVNTSTLKQVSFLQTNTPGVIELITIIENVNMLQASYKDYKKALLLDIFNVEKLSDIDESLQGDLHIISKHIDNLYNHSFSKSKRIKTKALTSLLDELNNAKASSNGYYEILGNSITKAQYNTLKLAMFDSKDKNIENLYSLIQKKCLIDGNFPTKKLVVSFEKSFKNIPTMNTDEVDIMTYQQARETLAKIDFIELEKITKKKAHSTEDIKKAIKKNILSVDVETLEVLETYKIKF